MNETQISEKKFERIRWSHTNGFFKGSWGISRKPLGQFNVCFEVDSTNGRTKAEVTSEAYKALYWTEMFNSYKEAVEGVRKRFETIEQLIEPIREEERKQREKCIEVLNSVLSVLLKTQTSLSPNDNRGERYISPKISKEE